MTIVLGSESKTSKAKVVAILILVAVGGATLLISSRVGGVQVYDVYPTDSMLQTLEVGDLVVIQSVPYSSLHIGDVIVFSEPNGNGGCFDVVIVHRIVNITGQGLYTQGDNRLTNPVTDPWDPVTPNCVKGEVIFAVPYLGRISEAFPPPLNYILVAIIIAAVFMIEFSGGRKRDEKEDAMADRTPKQALTIRY